MIDENQFEAIRPYRDEEVKPVIEKLLSGPYLSKALDFFFCEATESEVREVAKDIDSVQKFQDRFISYILAGVIKNTIDQLTATGGDNINHDLKHLYIGNHRDIVLDSALLNFYLNEKGWETSEIAIGNNLLVLPEIEAIVKLNKSFIVKRDGGTKEMYHNSQVLSHYIRKKIGNNESSIWLAQREGRAKDSNDITHSGLLKMLQMSGDSNIHESFKSLNIIPYSISYEYDPCAGMKAREFFVRSIEETYEKKPGEDLKSMQDGIRGYKGRINLSFGKPLNQICEPLSEIKNKNKYISAIGELIDQQLHQIYHLWPSNYIAFDLMHGASEFTEYYSESDVNAFIKHRDQQLEPFGEIKEKLYPFFYAIYANPVKNFKAVL
ncbi:acyltransferase [Aureibacter tunicatorum]|nr:acyltransferase [Aureibacter tunicatorum]